MKLSNVAKLSTTPCANFADAESSSVMLEIYEKDSPIDGEVYKNTECID
jgi:hypothetical protein